MPEPFVRAGLKCLRTDPRLDPRGEDVVRIKKDNYAMMLPGELFDEMDDEALSAFFESQYAHAVKYRIRIFKMGLIESHKRGLPLQRRWHWECRQCGSTDWDGYRRAIDAEAGAQNHVDERHADDH
jgi:hypothetical protein